MKHISSKNDYYSSHSKINYLSPIIMKFSLKTILSIVVLITFNSCTSNESLLEEFIKNKMDDPSSFELISIDALDTTKITHSSSFLVNNERYKKADDKTDSLNTIDSNYKEEFEKYEKSSDEFYQLSKKADKKSMKSYLGYSERERARKDYIYFGGVSYKYGNKADSIQDLRKSLSLIIEEYSEELELIKSEIIMDDRFEPLESEKYDIISYKVKFRGKNKFGALIIDKVFLSAYDGKVFNHFEAYSYALDKIDAEEDDSKKLIQGF